MKHSYDIVLNKILYFDAAVFYPSVDKCFLIPSSSLLFPLQRGLAGLQGSANIHLASTFPVWNHKPSVMWPLPPQTEVS